MGSSEIMIYATPRIMSRTELEQYFGSGEESKIAEALLSVANYDEDWQYAQAWCLHFLASDNPELARIAALGLADVDRRHRKLNYSEVVEAINRRYNGENVTDELSERLDLTLEDIHEGYEASKNSQQ